MEAAEIAKNKEAILLLREKFAQVNSVQPAARPFDQIVFNEAALDSAASALNSMDKALLSSGKHLFQQMSSGGIPCGIWKAFASKLNVMKGDIQNLIDSVQSEIKNASPSAKENIPKNLQEENKKLKKEVEELRSALKKETQILKCEKIVNELMHQEKHCIAAFRGKYERGESMEWDDVGLYMNVAGISHHFKKLQDFGCSADRAMTLITEVPAALDLPIADKLQLKFANHLFKNSKFQSLEDHVANCQICRQPTQVFLKEFFPAGTENKKGLSPSQLMMVNTLPECIEVFGIENAQEKLKTAKDILEVHSAI